MIITNKNNQKNKKFNNINKKNNSNYQYLKDFLLILKNLKIDQILKIIYKYKN
jgi:hypothetical protein